MRYFILLFILGIGTVSYSQKIIEKVINSKNISEIEIDSNLLYNISITTSKNSDIQIKTKVQGENFEKVLLSIKEKDKTLYLKPEFIPFFELENDKLATHKVVSIELDLQIPESMILKINSSLASLEMNGAIKTLEVNLENGNVQLKNFSGNAFIKTNRGSIIAYAKNKVVGNGISKYGKVYNKLNNKGNLTLQAESIQGDISLFLIEE